MPGLDGTARIYIVDTLLLYHLGTVGVSENYCVVGIGIQPDIQLVDIMKHIQLPAVDFDGFMVRQPTGPLAHIHVAAHGYGGSNFFQGRDYLHIADIPGMHDQICIPKDL